MKKTIPIILSLILVMSIAVNAGWLEGLFGQATVTGAQISPFNKVSIQPPTVTFKGLIGPTETVFLKYGVATNLKNGVTAKSTYNVATKTATVTFSKTITLTNNDKVKFDDGTWTVTVTSGLTGIGGVTFSRGTTVITNRGTAGVATGAAVATVATANRPHVLVIKMNTGKNVPVSLQYDKTTTLPNGFTATAKHNVAGGATVTFSKTVTITNNDKFTLSDAVSNSDVLYIADPVWVATVTADGVKLSGIATKKKMLAGNVSTPAKVATPGRPGIVGYFFKIFNR